MPAPSLLSPADDARFNAGQTITFDWSDVAGADELHHPDRRPGELLLADRAAVRVSLDLLGECPADGAHVVARVRTVNAAGAPGGWSSARRFELR